MDDQRLITPCPACGQRSLFIGTGGKGLRVAEALLAKIERNRSREYRHGKAF